MIEVKPQTTPRTQRARTALCAVQKKPVSSNYGEQNRTVRCMVKFLFLLFLSLCFYCDIEKKTKKVNLPFKNVRVGILSKYKLNKFSVSVKNAILFTDAKTETLKNDTIYVEKNNSKLSIIRKTSNKKNEVTHFIIESQELIKISFEEKERNYSGSIEALVKNGQLVLINQTDAESYVTSAALAESGILLEKLKEKKQRVALLNAMKISVRSYLFSNLERHPHEDYHVCDLTHCVHFPQNLTEKEEIPSAPEVLLTEDNTILTAYFHSSCGGNLSSPGIYWHGHENNKYYRKEKDSLASEKILCDNSPQYSWHAQISKIEMKNILGAKNISDLKPVYENNRVSYLTYSEKENTAYRGKKISAAAFLSKSGRLLGWNKIKSNHFSLTENIDSYTIKGRGLGHGIGLCQWGAMRQALEGRTAREILEFYFPSAKIAKAGY